MKIIILTIISILVIKICKSNEVKTNMQVSATVKYNYNINIDNNNVITQNNQVYNNYTVKIENNTIIITY